MDVGSQTFVPISWICKKQTSVSHSSTEAEIIFLDAGLRMDGIPALDLWDLYVEVFHSSPNQLNNTKDQVQGNLSRNTTSNKHIHNKTKAPIQHDNLDLSGVDYFSSSAKFSRLGAMLYILEDNEAANKMIIKGRSPTMSLFNMSHFSSLLRSEFQVDQLHQNDGKTDARTGRRQQDRGKVTADGDEPDRRQVLRL